MQAAGRFGESIVDPESRSPGPNEAAVTQVREMA